MKYNDIPETERLISQLKVMKFDKNDNRIMQYLSIFNNDAMKSVYFKIQNDLRNHIQNILNFKKNHNVYIDRVSQFN